MSRHLPSWLRVALGLLLVAQTVLPYLPVLPPPVALADSAAVPTLAALPAPAPAAFAANPRPAAAPASLYTPSTSAAAPIAGQLILSLTAEPAQVEPGDVLTYTATIANAGDAPLTAIVLTDTLPAELVYVAQSAVGFDYDPRAGQLTWAVGTVAPGATVTGSFQARVQGAALGGTIVNRVAASAVELAQSVTAQAAITVKLPAAARAQITPAGGVLVGREGRVLLVFAAGSVTAPVEVAITAAPADTVLPPQLLEAFQLTATDEAGRAVTRFARPVTVILNLAGYDAMLRARQGSPGLYWLDETRGAWQALSSQVDWGRGTATATVDHFSIFGAGTTSTLSYGAQHLPTVHGFVSDPWSGNSSVSYPLALPPGPGDLNLNLSLDYSSEGVNSIRAGASISGTSTDESRAKTFNRQAGFVGWGWSLGGLGQVTVKLPEAQQYYLGFGGGSFELKYDAANGWQTEPQSFLRIEHSQDGLNSDPWYVWTPDGTRYTFGSSGGWGNGEHWVRNTGSCGRHALAMHLTEVQDTHGNKAVVTYDATETKNIKCADNSSQPYMRAIRPTRLEYFAATEPLATARVNFGYASRSDTGVPGQNDDYTESFWSAFRLTTISVAVRNGTAADAFATVRSYTLDNDHYQWKDQATGQGLLLLMGVVEQGRDGGALPAWSFSYTMPKGNEWLNHTLLATADNGQGGRVTFSYGEANNIYIGLCSGNTTRYRVSQMEVSDGLGSQAHNVTRSVFDHQQPFAWANSGDYPLCAKDFEFGGYGFVRQEVRDGAGALYQVTDNYYHQCGAGTPPQACKPNDPNRNEAMDLRKGKAYLSVTSSQPGSDPLARVATTWITSTVKATTWVAKADETNYLGGSAQKTAYAYQTANQNGAQYGNVTHVREYSDSGATLYRTRERWYYPKNVAGGTYIVNRLAQEKLWQGDAGSSCQAQTRYIYDNPNSGWMTAPTVGDLVKQRQESNICDDTGTDAGWLTAFYGYDGWGNRIAVTDTLTHTTLTAYDTSGSWPKLYAYPISETLPAVNGLNLTTIYTWDKVLGQVTSVTDPNNVVTSYVYDEFGRQIKLIKPGDDATNPTIKFSYTNYAGATAPYWVKQEQRDNLSSAPPATYLESRTFYDGLGRTVQTQGEVDGSTSSIVSQKYNPLGVVQATAPYTHTQALGVGGNYRTPDWNQPSTYPTYDALGRPVQVTQPDNTLMRTYYQDRKTAAIDPLNHQTIQEADVFGRLINARQYEGTYAGAPNWGAAVYAQAQYQYDVADRLKQVIGADTVTTTLTYDLAGRKMGMTDPDMGSWSYAYDAAGNLLRQTDAKNQRLCFYYDTLNRLKGKTYSTGTTACPADPGYTGYAVKYYYDKDENGNAVSNGKGRRTVMIDLSGNTRWLYDSRGRVWQETRVISGTGGGTFVTQRSYDAADRLVWQKYPGGANGEIGEQVNTTYTSQGLLRQVQSNGGVYYVGDTLYNVRGQVYERRLGSTVGVVKQLYDYAATENFRLTAFRSGVSPNYNTLQNVTYSYDDAGNVLTIADAAAFGGSQTQSFSYDALDRLATAQAAGGSYGTYSQRSYAYSNAGNITSFEGATFTYNDAAHKHAITHVGGVQKYWYDVNGNATRRINGSQDITLGYDAENRLVGMSGAVTEAHVHDGDGNRVKAVVNGTTSVFIGNYYEWTGSTATVKSYYYAGGARVAMRTGTPITGTLNYLLSDHLGSTATTTDASGNRVTELRYYSWGGARYNPGGQLTTYRFTGQRWDSGTAMYFYGARWYDPVIGRFLAADSIVPQPGNPQALNRYSYALNNALRYTDPTGHFTDDAIKAYLQGLYGDAWEQYWNTWQADKGWWALLGAAQEGDTLYRYSYDSSGNPTVDSYRFAGKGREVLSGVYQGEGQNRKDVDLSRVYANKGAGIAGIHVNDNSEVKFLGATGNLSPWFHQISYAEDRFMDVLRSYVVPGALGGGVGSFLPGKFASWWGVVVGIAAGWFGDDLHALPGTNEGDYVLRVYMGRQEGKLLWAFEVDLDFRGGVNNGFSVQTWQACDNGRRW